MQCSFVHSSACRQSAVKDVRDIDRVVMDDTHHLRNKGRDNSGPAGSDDR